MEQEEDMDYTNEAERQARIRSPPSAEGSGLRGDAVRPEIETALREADDHGTHEAVAMLRTHIAALEKERDAALADNAEILKALLSSLEVPITHNLRLYVRSKFEKEPHPGVALLEEHRKALVRARNDGLEKAAAVADHLSMRGLHPFPDTISGVIRAMKEPE